MREEVLKSINKEVKLMNGLPIKENSYINEMRLQPFAILILFYNLNKLLGCFDFKVAKKFIKNNSEIKNLIDRVMQHGNTKKLQRH